MATQQDLQTLQATLSNYIRIQFLLTVVGPALPTQAQVDQLAAVGVTTNLLGVKVTYTKDGINYLWTEFQTFLIDAIDKTQSLLVRLSGPYQLKSRYQV